MKKKQDRRAKLLVAIINKEDEEIYTSSNAEGMRVAAKIADSDFEGFCFVRAAKFGAELRNAVHCFYPFCVGIHIVPPKIILLT